VVDLFAIASNNRKPSVIPNLFRNLLAFIERCRNKFGMTGLLFGMTGLLYGMTLYGMANVKHIKKKFYK